MKIIEEIKKIKSIADLGLLYCTNDYDKERYEELLAISLSLFSQIGDHKIEDLKDIFILVKEYPTVKVDIRAFVLSEDKKILMVKESADGKWALPGGWADIGYSAKETAVKECKEETGLDVEAIRLLAVFDKKMHQHPSQAFYVYKIAIYCELKSSELQKGFDVLDVQFFSIDNLPTLSEDRILKSQIELLFHQVVNGDLEAYFD
jgi:ADP-ribose pyrophosphatase YjhB (NUDIX family)